MSEQPLEIDVHAVNQMLDSTEEFLLLDCREPDEHAFARVEAAKLIPMSELMVRVGELEEFADKPIVVMCHLGGRSLRVTHWLRQNGFPQTQNMTGGIDAWSKEIDSDIPTY